MVLICFFFFGRVLVIQEHFNSVLRTPYWYFSRWFSHVSSYMGCNRSKSTSDTGGKLNGREKKKIRADCRSSPRKASRGFLRVKERSTCASSVCFVSDACGWRETRERERENSQKGGGYIIIHINVCPSWRADPSRVERYLCPYGSLYGSRCTSSNASLWRRAYVPTYIHMSLDVSSIHTLSLRPASRMYATHVPRTNKAREVNHSRLTHVLFRTWIKSLKKIPAARPTLIIELSILTYIIIKRYAHLKKK